MRDVSGTEHLRAFEFTLNGVFLLDGEDAEQLASLAVDQRHVFADTDAVAEFLRTGQRDRDGPKEPVAELHILTAALPVRLTHEAVEWCVSAHAQHEQVGDLAAGQRDLLQAGGPPQLFRPLDFRQ
jgi:hypothetical protein